MKALSFFVSACKPGLTLVGQECIKVSAVLGGTCTNDVGCQIPGSYCSDKGKCECIPGAISTGSSCSFSKCSMIQQRHI